MSAAEVAFVPDRGERAKQKWRPHVIPLDAVFAAWNRRAPERNPDNG